MVRRHPDTVSGLDKKPVDYVFTAEDTHKALAAEVTRKRKRLPPVLNNNSLFTRSAPLASPQTDIYYHPPSSRIARVLSPGAFDAAFDKDARASISKEENPQAQAMAPIRPSSFTGRARPPSAINRLRPDSAYSADATLKKVAPPAPKAPPAGSPVRNPRPVSAAPGENGTWSRPSTAMSNRSAPAARPPSARPPSAALAPKGSWSRPTSATPVRPAAGTISPRGSPPRPPGVGVVAVPRTKPPQQVMPRLVKEPKVSSHEPTGQVIREVATRSLAQRPRSAHPANQPGGSRPSTANLGPEWQRTRGVQGGALENENTRQGMSGSSARLVGESSVLDRSVRAVNRAAEGRPTSPTRLPPFLKSDPDAPAVPGGRPWSAPDPPPQQPRGSARPSSAHPSRGRPESRAGARYGGFGGAPGISDDDDDELVDDELEDGFDEHAFDIPGPSQYGAAGRREYRPAREPARAAWGDDGSDGGRQRGVAMQGGSGAAAGIPDGGVAWAPPPQDVEEWKLKEEEWARRFSRVLSPEEQVAMADGICRYYWYIHHGLQDGQVAPMNDAWMAGALQLVPVHSLAPRMADRASRMMKQLVEDARRDYQLAVRRSIVNYLLQHRCEVERLQLDEAWGLMVSPVPWRVGEPGSLPDECRCPVEWHQAAGEAALEVGASLRTLDRRLQRLGDAWDGFGDALLLDLGPGSHLEEMLPVSAETFREHQVSHCDAVRRRLHAEWVPRAAEALLSSDAAAAAAGGGDHAPRVAELALSNQVRGLVEGSVAALQGFFGAYEAMLHGEPEQLDLHGGTAMWANRAAFTVDIVVSANKLKFSPSMREVQSCAVAALDHMVQSVYSLAGAVKGDHERRGAEGAGGREAGGAPGGGRGGRGEEGAGGVKPPIYMGLDDLPVTGCKALIARVVEEAAEAPRQILAHFEKYEHLLDVQVDDFLAEHGARAEAAAAPTNAKGVENKDPLRLEAVNAEVVRLRAMAEEIESSSAAAVRTLLFVVGVRETSQALADRARDLSHRLLQTVLSAMSAENAALCEQFQSLAGECTTSSDTEEEAVARRKFMQGALAEMEKLEKAVRRNQQREEFLFGHRFEIPGNDFEISMVASEWPRRMRPILDESRLKNADEVKAFERKLRARREGLKAALEEKYRPEVEAFKLLGNMAEKADFAKRVDGMDTALREAQAESVGINDLEKLFGWPKTGFEEIKEMKSATEPFVLLWMTAVNFDESTSVWANEPMARLDPEAIEAETSGMFRAVYKACRFFEEVQLEGPLKVAEIVRGKIQDFQEHIPLLHALCNPGLRERHWAAIGDIVGFPLDRDSEHQSLRFLLSRHVDKHTAALEEVSDGASKEHGLERTLDKMEADWGGVEFDLSPWRETGTFILKGGPVDEVQALLDDQVVKTQAMAASQAASVFMERTTRWERTLLQAQDTLDEWLTCQQKWLYLEPIFGSEDIMQQMPEEGTRFKAVDAHFRKVMETTQSTPGVLEVTAVPWILEALRESNRDLEMIERGLNLYLETKRKAFPRFYFLSNDELLEILSETKDPLRVQPFVKKCFEGIQELEFQKRGTIAAMVSSEGERVPFVRVINPGSHAGQVERWLTAVWHAMRDSLHATCGKSLAAYQETPRAKWVLEWPGQVVLCVGQIFWTQQVAEAMADGPRGLKAYEQRATEQLEDVVEIVRGQLTDVERATVGALVVIDVHARDVVTALCEAGVADEQDFDWLSQMRYYWQAEPGGGAPAAAAASAEGAQTPDEAVRVKMINADIKYGYEYLGNSSRLVITPLTDRCYRTLMGAVHLNMGGAPEGPAGTGKTETTKDLAKALGMACVVFNCSDGLDYLAMGKFFKGLASSGAWACFDEFNRIELEVLSVIAQQILTIQRAVAAKQDVLNFEGTELALNRTCNVFITMNPGYAGRSELPDNLKALFRTVAMMVPNYAMIAEIILYSFGYKDARDLARKLVATYRLCSEQLSSQDHYDYGMRAVIAVLRAAGNLKRKQPDVPEPSLMLRAIYDVNAPKFLIHDMPLFRGIMKDLFPGVELREPDYGHLVGQITAAARRLRLQPVDGFIEKTIQLYEMILVRHGLMLVGYSFGCKTSSYRCLAAALTGLKEAGQMGENTTHSHVINPKSITMGQLYGQFDQVSHEWTDGVLALTFRNCARDTSPDRHWIVFDGPVDAVWIENMNTVLDDNKKLCLNSGEIIAMSGRMNLIFEVQDLAVASPATVSRCGMVYVEPTLLGWEPLFTSWKAALPPHLTAASLEQVDHLFMWLVPPLLRCVEKECRQPVAMQGINLVQATMRLFSCMIADVADKQVYTNADEKTHAAWLDGCFLFAVTWGLGGNVDEDGRRAFDALFKRLLMGVPPENYRPYIKLQPRKVTVPFPKDDKRQVYDYKFDKDEQHWVEWGDTVERAPIDVEMEFRQIIVPTADTIRYRYLLEVMLLRDPVPVLLIGPTGTGKTLFVEQFLHALPADQFSYLQMTFSAQTSANATQDIIDGKMDRRRKGVSGPPPGKRMALFIDDLNMPQLETYGAQPPIELLRQYMDHGGWYARPLMSFQSIIDVQWCAAMGLPGGGRNPVTNRYLRHFNVVSVTDFSAASLTAIFGAITEWWMARERYGETVSALKLPLVAASIEVYNAAQEGLLPTPAKSHYTFNLRDLVKVFQGLQLADAQSVPGADEVKRLWVHEVLRVFHDRLVDDADRQWMVDLVGRMTDRHFRDRLSRITKRGDRNSVPADSLRTMLFGDFMVMGSDKRQYAEIPDVASMERVMVAYLEDYNVMSKSPMQLVMFLYACEHVARICRVLKQPGGHALLVGVGGSGRQSLTRLSAFVMEMDVLQVEISKSYGVTEWHDDLKRVLRQAGEHNKPTVFLLADTQIRSETFVEDVGNLLNTGEVPNLFDGGDQLTIGEGVRKRARQAGVTGDSKAELFNFFVTGVRRNLHVVLAMSPVGGAFVERLRKFPALVNCTTIDWFFRWPSDALVTVAKKFLGPVEVEHHLKPVIADLCQKFHKDCQRQSDRFRTEMRRYFYATPTSYLDLISSYSRILKDQQGRLNLLKSRYTVGLDKLVATEESVDVMREELEALGPQLAVAEKETSEMMVVVAAEEEEANKVRAVVSEEEAAAQAEAAKVKAIKDECESDLSEAMPLLNAALRALDTLSKKDLEEIGSYKSPPKAVRVVMEAVCHMQSRKPSKIRDPATGKDFFDYWDASKRALRENDFLDQLSNYDKDNIPPSVIKKIAPYLSMPDFQPKSVEKVSKAAYGLCCWVRAMEAYDRVAKVVGPKKESLAVAEAQFESVMGALREKQQALARVEAKLADLAAQLQGLKDKAADLERQVDLCAKKLERADQLITGLAGEKARWKQQSESLGGRYDELTGDVLLGAASVAYLGAFTPTYRSELADSWLAQCREGGLPTSGDYSFVGALGDPVKLREWNICGLPTDTFSAESALMVKLSKRWPLMIDPQSQANKWVKNMEKGHGIKVCKLSDPGFLRTLENAVQFGVPVLLENVGEELDAALEPLLLRQTFKEGGQMCIRLGDASVPYSDDFRMYITTKLRNPHYLPDVCVRVTLLNFMITPEGLEDQVLGLTVAAERPDLEEEKNALIVAGADNRRQLAEIEDRILEVLSSSEGNILEDEQAVNVLKSSKELSDRINERQKVADETEAQIDVARQAYRPVAARTALLFFCVADMAAIDSMYQYSLAWFFHLYGHSLSASEKSEDLDQRMTSLNAHFTFHLYKNVCRSLFDKDKLVFAFLLATRLQGVPEQELRFALTGGVALEGGDDEPPARWVSGKNWGDLCRLSASYEGFEGLRESFVDAIDAWREVYDAPEPHKVPLPDPWDQMGHFQRLCVLRCVRPDKMVSAVRDYCAAQLGSRFMDPMGFDLAACFLDSSPTVPLVFILSPGNDPTQECLKFAERKGAHVATVSLGQGQGPVAERQILEAIEQGGWVLLQNCHLASSWMPQLEQLCEQRLLPGKCHEDFRLFLTSYPSPTFPTTLLESSVKMTNEAPRGLRSNLLRSYTSDPVSDPAFFGKHPMGATWRGLLFALCFFHAFVQERRRFGPIGWNIPYEFNEGDLLISVQQLHMFLAESVGLHELPFKALRYTAGECNYGGRVTDDHDRRTLMTILADFYRPEFLRRGHVIAEGDGAVEVPPDLPTADAYVKHIGELPVECPPETFGLHANADISADMREATSFFDAVLCTQAGAGGGGGGSGFDEAVSAVVEDVLSRFPRDFDVEAAQEKFPVVYDESMNTVLCQEMVRYNRLLSKIRSSMTIVKRALAGLMVMSGEYEHMAMSLFNGQVPDMWRRVSFASRKPLASYIKDLLDRVAFLQGWHDGGVAPAAFWLPGFFFTHSFLTAAKQNYARKHKVEIDRIEFDFAVKDEPGDIDEAPANGVYVHGMFLEGARWGRASQALIEAAPKELTAPMPPMHLLPKEASQLEEFDHYLCPMYKTSDRRGVLSTTGHSTNFVMDIKVPSDRKGQEHWIKRGCAMLLSLDD